jgi:hypothetical protein
MTDQAALDSYLADMRRVARKQGERAARTGDPDAFDAAKEAIRRLAAASRLFTSDDLPFEIRGPSVGAAFRVLSQEGEILHCGYEASKLSRYGGVVSIWKGAT